MYSYTHHNVIGISLISLSGNSLISKISGLNSRHNTNKNLKKKSSGHLKTPQSRLESVREIKDLRTLWKENKYFPMFTFCCIIYCQCLLGNVLNDESIYYFGKINDKKDI